MGHPSSVDVGCNSTKEFRDTYKIEESDIASLIKGIPEEVEVPKSVPLIGGTKIRVKENVKTLLDGIKDNPLQPCLIVRFTVQGNCDGFDNTTIEAASHRITGCKSGSVTVAGVGIDISLDADISPEQMVVEECKCGNGTDGERHKRMFHITWTMNLSINPGVGGTFDVAEYDVAVYSCCCQNFDDDDDGDDEEEQGGDEEPDGEEEDYELIDPARNVAVVYRETRAAMPPNAALLFTTLDDEQKKNEEDEKKKKFDEEKKRKQDEKAAKKQKPRKHKHHEPEQGGAEHTTNKSKSKKDKHEKGQRQKKREEWERKRKHKHWTPFGKGKKKTQQQHKPPSEAPKPPEHPHSGNTPKGGASPEQPHGTHGS